MLWVSTWHGSRGKWTRSSCAPSALRCSRTHSRWDTQACIVVCMVYQRLFIPGKVVFIFMYTQLKWLWFFIHDIFIMNMLCEWNTITVLNVNTEASRLRRCNLTFFVFSSGPILWTCFLQWMHQWVVVPPTNLPCRSSAHHLLTAQICTSDIAESPLQVSGTCLADKFLIFPKSLVLYSRYENFKMC